MERKKSGKSSQKPSGEGQSKGEQTMSTPGRYKPRSVLAEVDFEIIGTGNDNTVIGYVTGATGKGASQFKPGTFIAPSFSAVTVDLEEVARRAGQ